MSLQPHCYILSERSALPPDEQDTAAGRRLCHDPSLRASLQLQNGELRYMKSVSSSNGWSYW